MQVSTREVPQRSRAARKRGPAFTYYSPRSRVSRRTSGGLLAGYRDSLPPARETRETRISGRARLGRGSQAGLASTPRLDTRDLGERDLGRARPRQPPATWASATWAQRRATIEPGSWSRPPLCPISKAGHWKRPIQNVHRCHAVHIIERCTNFSFNANVTTNTVAISIRDAKISRGREP